MMFGIGGVILGLILLVALPWWVGVLVIAAAIAIPVVAWRSLDPSQRRRIRNMRSRGQLGR
jgi:membrane protein implicated in regulation of membrane protease activity